MHMQVKGHKSKSKKRKLEDTSTSDRSVLINDNGSVVVMSSCGLAPMVCCVAAALVQHLPYCAMQ